MVKESNLHNPLDFFVSISDANAFKNFLVEFIEYGGTPYSFVNPTTVRIPCLEDYGEWIDRDFHISYFIGNKLDEEFTRSKNLIQTYTLENTTENAVKYLKIQFSIIQTIVDKRTSFLIEYPDIFKFLKALADHIVFLLHSLDTTNIQLDYEKFLKAYERSNRTIITQEEQDDLIMLVLGYMKGQNQAREIILSEADFNLLIQYTIHLVKKGEIPEIETQLSPNIHQRLLAFSFWVLHKELYTTTRIKPHFISFLKNIFSNFENVSEESIRGFWGTKTQIKKDDFLPEIIKKHLS
ncbi:hypothetical protein CGC58_07475 [Capnocytophaga stomatis]|uniref:Uncharacterized protein n=1 Tax=Capnocytophaga stomatis TaxID=1848904 RepID=A0A250FWX9_9FLAO|nr:hypothetical protein [Capnocytophaga stomatis]ATA89583.1 hypothetical protein CGC58_07475 [Capnocytophaga stomatis]